MSDAAPARTLGSDGRVRVRGLPSPLRVVILNGCIRTLATLEAMSRHATATLATLAAPGTGRAFPVIHP